MIADFTLICQKQKKLNDYIFAKHQVKFNDVKQKLLLALSVELAELANEVRCFKYWSNKPQSPEAIILAEYVDGIHFIATFLNELQVKQKIILKIGKKLDLTFFFNQLFSLLAKVNFTESLITQKKAMFDYCVAYLRLGAMLGFDWKKICAGYDEKNKINFQRQAQNY